MLRMSVVIPVFNGSKTLDACLRSISQSTGHDLEIIVVDDGSTDSSRELALKYTSNVIPHGQNQGLVAARSTGIASAKGEIVINIDADVVILPNTLQTISDYFNANPQVSALTGRLSKSHPHKNFFSQYKNLYMNYIFGKLPERVNFLYGSIHALKRDAVEIYRSIQNIGEDSERGQRLVQAGKKIAFLKDLEVIHLKKYTFISWVKNDFSVPFWWARLFVRYKGWKSFGKNKTGYLHSPKEQLASVVIVPLSLLVVGVELLSLIPMGPSFILFIFWGILNASFISFLWKEKGAWFGLRSIFVTFLDHLIMATGIFFGIVNTLLGGHK